MKQIIVAKDDLTAVVMDITEGPPKEVTHVTLEVRTHAQLFEAIEKATDEVGENLKVSFITIFAS